MNESDYQFNLLQVREALAAQAEKYPLLPGLCYRCLYDFVLQHGREYRPRTYPPQYESGAEKQCYGNAITLAGRCGLKYIEGVALAPTGEIISHGWNADAGDELVDSTWLNTGLVYLGVEFSIERADDATWNGDSHVLNDEAHNYPVFRQPWQGEDYGIKWPYSDRIEAYRVWRETGIFYPPPSMVAWLMERPRNAMRSFPYDKPLPPSGDGSHGG